MERYPRFFSMCQPLDTVFFWIHFGFYYSHAAQAGRR
jgi:hypothetical protein